MHPQPVDQERESKLREEEGYHFSKYGECMTYAEEALCRLFLLTFQLTAALYSYNANTNRQGRSLMSNTRGALVIVGSGPGIGSHVARTFSSHGFTRIILLSRDPSRLEEDAKFIRSATPSANIFTLAIDLSKTSEIPSALSQVDKALGDTPIEVVVFNAARVGPSTLVSWPMEELELDLRIKVTGCYAVAQWAIPKLLAVKNTRKPAFLCTSGSIYKDPVPEVFSLSVCKAGQHNLVHSMHKKYKEEGVYCGLVVVGGVVGDDHPQCNAENIANKTWALYEQGHDLEVEILDG